jgi:hypothetical protein
MSVFYFKIEILFQMNTWLIIVLFVQFNLFAAIACVCHWCMESGRSYGNKTKWGAKVNPKFHKINIVNDDKFDEVAFTLVNDDKNAVNIPKNVELKREFAETIKQIYDSNMYTDTEHEFIDGLMNKYHNSVNIKKDVELELKKLAKQLYDEDICNDPACGMVNDSKTVKFEEEEFVPTIMVAKKIAYNDDTPPEVSKYFKNE